MRYENLTLTGQRLELDGNEFVGCTLTLCTLIYRGGPVVLMDNSTLNDCNFVFAGAAENTVNFMKGLWGIGKEGRAIVQATFESISPEFKQKTH